MIHHHWKTQHTIDPVQDDALVAPPNSTQHEWEKEEDNPKGPDTRGAASNRLTCTEYLVEIFISTYNHHQPEVDCNAQKEPKHGTSLSNHSAHKVKSIPVIPVWLLQLQVDKPARQDERDEHDCEGESKNDRQGYPVDVHSLNDIIA